MQTDLRLPATGIQLEHAACPLCGGRDSTRQLEAADPSQVEPACRYTVVRCSECGLCFTSPRPTLETIASAYASDYGPHQSQGSCCRSRRQSRWSRRMAQWRRRRHLDWQGEGRLLDFGCGSGSFLARMDEEGWKVVGLDVSPKVVDHIRSELGLPAMVGSLPHPQLQPQSFDVITMWQSLEHVHHPLAVLEDARRLLAPDGRLVLSVPNFAGASARWFGPYWFGLDLPRHLTHFSPETLRRMVERAGFRVEHLGFVGHATWLQASARQACRSGVALGWRRWLALRSVCRLVAWSQVLAGISEALMLTAVAD